MTSNRIEEIQKMTAYPNSQSVMLALKQVWNECEQDKTKYSEEDLKQAYLDGCKTQLTHTYHVNEWFKGFKKK